MYSTPTASYNDAPEIEDTPVSRDPVTLVDGLSATIVVLNPKVKRKREFSSESKTAQGHTLYSSEHRAMNSKRLASSYAGSIAPPRYSAIFADPEELLPVGAPPTQHDFPLLSGLFTRKPIGTLRVFSRPSIIAQRHPLYFGGENVAGSINLKLDTPQVINSISVSLKGQIVSSFSEDIGYYTFLLHTENVWNKAEGDPRGSAESQNNFNGKLSGDLQFSFSFPFPVTVDFTALASSKAKGPGTLYETPQTFLEHNVTTNIQYELALLVTHGGLRPDSKVKARIRFIPKTVPDRLPGLRQLAYRSNTAFPGPEVDTEGWHALPAIPISGVLQNNQTVNVDYTLYIANPLCYTRGTVIPCYLIVSSQDHRSLDMLASIKIQNVRLSRHVRYSKLPSKAVEQHLQGKNTEFQEAVTEVGHAVWWIPPKDVPQEPLLKRLQGEIHLAKELAPSSDFLPLSIEYFVEVLPFITDDFRLSPQKSPYEQDSDKSPEHRRSILLSYRVTIATFKAKGPCPRAFTEPPANPMTHSDDDDNPDTLMHTFRSPFTTT